MKILSTIASFLFILIGWVIVPLILGATPWLIVWIIVFNLVAISISVDASRDL